MFAGTEVPRQGEPFTVSVKATATGVIAMWFYEENPKLGGKDLEMEEGWNLCTIEVRVNGFSRFEDVKAPVRGYLVKIIKKELELVKKGETIAEMKPLIPIHKVPPELREEFYDSVG